MMKSLKLPTERHDPMWSLTDRDYLFLDLTILFNKRHADLYRMVSSGTATEAQLAKKASAITTSADGVEYLAARKTQLENYYWPNDVTESGQITEKQPAQSTEQMLAELIPDVVKNLKNIAKDPNNDNYGDLVKTVLGKILKDMGTKNQAQPPMRYLPVVPCNSCEYRIFIEESGNVENCCLQCKYRAFGIEHGLTYDYKNQLEK